MFKWIQGADVITILILKVITIHSVINAKHYLTFAQLPTSLGRPQDYGPVVPSGTSSGGGGSNTNSEGGGSGSGEVLAPKSFAQEPTCEELRAMWIFSKRQSRAAEMTNEIPTYRDPFTYNVWEPYYATTRSLGGMRILPRYRDSTRPVYGRIIHREPLMRLAERTRTLEDISHLYNAGDGGSKTTGGLVEPRRRVQFRFSGGTGTNNAGNSIGGIMNSFGVTGESNGRISTTSGSVSTNVGGANVNSLTPHFGSFQKLKELIWTERARELAQQRKSEEMAARAAALKEIANGVSHNNARRPVFSKSSPTLDSNRAINLLSSSASASLPTNQDNRHSSRSIVTLPSSSSLNRSGGIFLPSIQLPGQQQSGQQQLQQQNIKSSFPMRPSHFRERNRVLFRQSGTPLDYYQRDHRSESFHNQLGKLTHLTYYLQQLREKKQQQQKQQKFLLSELQQDDNNRDKYSNIQNFKF